MGDKASKKKTREFRLFKRDPREPTDLTDWGGRPLGTEEVDKLRVGDCVRLVLHDPDEDGCWEKIYFEIVQVDYYSKGLESRPRKFHGKAMDTYRLASTAYVRTGDVIEFQRENVIEIPGWRGDEVKTMSVPPQPRKDVLQLSKERIYRDQYRMADEEYAKQLEKEEEEERAKDISAAAASAGI